MNAFGIIWKPGEKLSSFTCRRLQKEAKVKMKIKMHFSPTAKAWLYPESESQL